MAAWADLPSDLLISISDRLDMLSCLRISAVCTTWASIVRPRLNLQPIPWLLLYVRNSIKNSGHTDFTFYDLTSYTSYCITSPIPFSLDGPHWIGSNFGRLVCIDQNSQLHLISPLTGAKQLLPSVKLPHGYQGNLNTYWDAHRNTLKFHSHEKVILCQVPDHGSGNDNGLLLLCFFRPYGLAILKVGDDNWTWLDLERHYLDAIVYQGKIYAMTADTLYCWEHKGSSFRAGKVILTIRDSILNDFTKYLVESGGKVLMVCRNNKEHCNHGKAMNVYELDLDQGRRLWRPVQSIGDNAIIMGLDYCRIASNIGLDSAKLNCIYYFDENCNDNIYKSFHFLLVYNCKKRKYDRFPIQKGNSPTPWFWPCYVK
ncbi:F-box protein [Carex littledalei]|uniref:F-box protein n=1 Tax=Carex littledalei TaxID=544730 RepID=A0A833RQL5_9POAL|nr:F-box protein [Carex littledalei]